jgi:hypothetical protein
MHAAETETAMSEKPQVEGVTTGALGLSALAFGACCVAPWAVKGWECDARGTRAAELTVIEN